MVATQHRVGGYAASEVSTVILPRDWKGDGTKPAVILARGFGDTFDTPYDAAKGQRLATALANAGFPVFHGDLGVGGNQWGNDTAIARIASAKTYMQGAAVGAKAGKIAGVGFSMGGLNLAAYAAANLSSVSCLALCAPVSDLADINGNATYTASITAAYGSAYTDAAFGAAHNPKLLAAAGAFGSLPVKAWYANNDVIIPQATVLANIAAIGASASAVDAGALGHSWNVQINNIAAIVDFIRQHA